MSYYFDFSFLKAKWVLTYFSFFILFPRDKKDFPVLENEEQDIRLSFPPSFPSSFSTSFPPTFSTSFPPSFSTKNPIKTAEKKGIAEEYKIQQKIEDKKDDESRKEREKECKWWI